MIRAVVLGANGFLGTALVRCLLRREHHVTTVARSSSPGLDVLRNNYSDHRFTAYLGDVNDASCLELAFNRTDIVYHLATSTHPTLNVADPGAEVEMALLPLIGVMKQATLSGVRKVVFPSSGGTIYRDQLAARCETTATDPRTPYAILKLTAEQLLLHAATRGEFHVDVMRIAILYGPGQPRRAGQGVLPHWLESLRTHHPLTLFGDGTASRDYVHIDDAAECLASCCDRLDQTDIFNVGTGQATSLNELLVMLQHSYPYTFQVNRVEARPTDLHSVCLDASKLLSQMPGFQWTPLANGLQKLCSEIALHTNPSK